MIKRFFKNLAYRVRNENALSDITWAMCNTSEIFKLTFLEFFFPKVKFDKIDEFVREKSKGNSRPDFYIKNGKDIYLIENKIYDTNHHFGQYEKAFGISKENLGYITNYPLKQEGYDVKNWEEFYNWLILKMRKYQLSEEEEGLWNGYIEYIESTCLIIKITKKMDLSGMYSLFTFNVILEKQIINRVTDNYCLKYYSNKCIHNWDGVSGKYFEIEYNEQISIDKTWAWVGVYYNRESPTISLGFENKENWGKPVCDIVKDNFLESEYASKPYIEDDALFFDLKEEKIIEFNRSNLDKQIDILKSFVDEVIMYPVNIIRD